MKSQLTLGLVYETFVYCVTLHGPLHRYLVVTSAFGLYVAAKSAPIVSPKIPKNVLSDVLPFPVTSQFMPTRGTTSCHFSTSAPLNVCSTLNCPARFV